MTPIKPCRASLRDLSDRAAVPGYDPAQVRPGIVHLGVGGFHRAHMARYTHALMALDEGALGWGIMGAGLLPADARIVEALEPQDWLYTLVERDTRTETVQIIGSLAGVVDGAANAAALQDVIVRPEIRIVSLTVTGH